MKDLSGLHAIRWRSVFMWLLPILFFAYQFTFRLWLGLVKTDVMKQFSIDATGFGLLSSIYYYGYAGMQIPVGLLIARKGPGFALLAMAWLCGIGGLIFSYTNNYTLALLGRFFIGTGSAVGFLATCAVISLFFPKKDYARMVGLSFALGFCGAIFGGGPLSSLITKYSGQTVGVALSFGACLIGTFGYIFLRKPPRQTEDQPNTLNTNSSTTSVQLKSEDFWKLLSCKWIWMIGAVNLLLVGVMEGLVDAWGPDFLVQAYHYSNSEAAYLVSYIFFGLIMGGPLLTSFSKKFNTYTLIGLCGLGIFLFLTAVLTGIITNTLLLSALFLIIGVMCCYQALIFASIPQWVSARYLGVATAFLNCLNMAGGLFFHTLIGLTTDFFWAGELSATGAKVYDLTAYRYGLGLIPLSALVGTVIIFFVGYRLRKMTLPLISENR